MWFLDEVDDANILQILTQLVDIMMINRSVWTSISPFIYQFYKDHTDIFKIGNEICIHTQKELILVLTLIWIIFIGLHPHDPQPTGLGCMRPPAMAQSAPRSSLRPPTLPKRCWPCPSGGWTTCGMWGSGSINSLRIVWTSIFTFLMPGLLAQTPGTGLIKTNKMGKVRKIRINVNKIM